MNDVLSYFLGFLALGLFKKQAENSIEVIEKAAKSLGLKDK